jgi:putative sterol carrier protein
LSLEEYKKSIEELFNKALEKMPEIRTWNKVYQFKLEDDGEFYIEIKNGELKVSEGTHPSPIATISGTKEVLNQILKGELDAMKAFMMRKIKISGNVLDTMNLKKLIDAGIGKI